MSVHPAFGNRYFDYLEHEALASDSEQRRLDEDRFYPHGSLDAAPLREPEPAEHFRANYEIVASETTPDCLVLRDNGPWPEYPTIAESVVFVIGALVYCGQLPPPAERLQHVTVRGQPARRVLYYDGSGQLLEIKLSRGEVCGIVPAEVARVGADPVEAATMEAPLSMDTQPEQVL